MEKNQENSLESIVNQTQTPAQFLASMSDEQISEMHKKLGISNDTPNCIVSSLYHYFYNHDEVTYKVIDIVDENNEVKAYEILFDKPIHLGISHITISDEYENSIIIDEHLYINSLNDFLKLYHAKYGQHKLKEFSESVVLKKEQVINYLLLKIDILCHSEQECGLIRFYDSYSFHIQECVGVYCRNFGIKIQNHFQDVFDSDFLVTDDDSKSFGIDTYVLTVYDSKKLGGIKTIVINKNFTQNIILHESNTIFINSFYYFLVFTGTLMKFLKYKILIN